MKKLNALVINPKQGKIHQIVDIPEEQVLEFMQKTVGGYIERAGTFLGHDVFCDEEGLLKKLEFGFRLDSLSCDVRGVGIILGPPDKDGNSTSCTLDPISFVDRLKFFVTAKEVARQLVIADFMSDEDDNDLTSEVH